MSLVKKDQVLGIGVEVGRRTHSERVVLKSEPGQGPAPACHACRTWRRVMGVNADSKPRAFGGDSAFVADILGIVSLIYMEAASSSVG